ncbi:hypothetical protein NA57DRAFT_80162 [Rhizodiscina lignyota]|uniref:Uncharacterized protein n=1 Tax=Rhizodiscina lignyota TaxID=1504668 RepID=A0A9P4I5Q2_9PEZI|nr:hypothetical protein NA57DRAFT_80162 [Rhizodiscina lignyota]
MVTTRSKAPKEQAKIEDFDDGKKPLGAAKQSKTPKPAKKPTKRKAPPASEDRQADAKGSKKQKTGGDDATGEQAILINRAPVLHLWAACVAHFVHPKLSWSTCLSAGSAISTITAIAKGRSIGTIEESKDTEAKRKKKEQRPTDIDIMEVMQFKLRIKDGVALVGSEQKGKPGNDGALKSKFGEDAYERVKKTFEESLETWKGDEEELNKQAFGFYEDFRPSVSAGQKGWGRKGQLNLDTIQSAVKRA